MVEIMSKSKLWLCNPLVDVPCNAPQLTGLRCEPRHVAVTVETKQTVRVINNSRFCTGQSQYRHRIHIGWLGFDPYASNSSDPHPSTQFLINLATAIVTRKPQYEAYQSLPPRERQRGLVDAISRNGRLINQDAILVSTFGAMQDTRS